jgi:hypothetical protein
MLTKIHEEAAVMVTQRARVLVPLLVKNGSNSAFQVWVGSNFNPTTTTNLNADSYFAVKGGYFSSSYTYRLRCPTNRFSMILTLPSASSLAS